MPGGRTHKAIRGDAIPPLIPLEKVKNANTAQEEYSSIIPPKDQNTVREQKNVLPQYYYNFTVNCKEL